MKKLSVLIILILTAFSSFCQDKMIVDQPFIGLPAFYSANTITIDSVNQIPNKIQFIVYEVFNKSMTDFSENIKFVKGQIIEIEDWLTNDSIPQTEYTWVIPKYQLYFELSDTLINIQKYCFEISLDQYGQIIKYEWPRENHNKRENFIDSKSILKNAQVYAKKKKYKVKKYNYELSFNSNYDELCWSISFLQKSSGDEYNFYKEFKTIVIGAYSNVILKEGDEIGIGNSCGGLK